MEIRNIEILKIINSISKDSAVSLRSIDMRIMKNYPELVLNKELLTRLEFLCENNYCSWNEKYKSVLITKLGIELLSSNSIE